jgi:hypothetical protein
MTTPPPPGHYDDEEEDEYSGEEDEEDYSNSEISSDGDYDSEERSLPPPEAADFIKFGSSLTVKGTQNMLIACDNVLIWGVRGYSNSGRRFAEE